MLSLPPEMVHALALIGLALGSTWPRAGIHAGNNRITWPTGCCEGDLVVVDFRDEQGDGNQGSGMVRITNTSSGFVNTYDLTPFGGMWKTFGPFCAPEGTHTLSFTSDANPSETTVTVTDSFGLIRAAGGMMDFPMSFNTTSPSKFCMPSGGFSETEKIKRAKKLIAYHNQFTPREILESEGAKVPYDEGFSVHQPK